MYPSHGAVVAPLEVGITPSCQIWEFQPQLALSLKAMGTGQKRPCHHVSCVALQPAVLGVN